MKSAALSVSLNLGTDLKITFLNWDQRGKASNLKKKPQQTILSLPVHYKHSDGDTLIAVSQTLNALANSSQGSCPWAAPSQLPWVLQLEEAVSSASYWCLSLVWAESDCPSLTSPSGRTALTPSPGTHLVRSTIITGIYFQAQVTNPVMIWLPNCPPDQIFTCTTAVLWPKPGLIHLASQVHYLSPNTQSNFPGLSLSSKASQASRRSPGCSSPVEEPTLNIRHRQLLSPLDGTKSSGLTAPHKTGQ